MKRLAAVLVLLALFAGTLLHAQSQLFWEYPEVFSQAQGTFPVTASNENFSIALWQETVYAATGDGRISIALAVKMPGEPWEKRGIIGGPYNFSGTEPSILTAVIDSKNQILIAAAASATQTEILISGDFGESFQHYRVDSGAETSLAPKISIAADGSYLLFVTRGGGNTFSIYFSRSADGSAWEDFKPLAGNSAMMLNFLPAHISFDGREYVVFQSFTAGAGGTNLFQLYMVISSDNGVSWSAPRLFTNFQDPVVNVTSSPDSFDNQRPHLSVQNDELFIVWERRTLTGLPNIYAANIGANGAISGAPQRVNSGAGHSNNPIAINFRGETKVFWFDNRRGTNRVFTAQQAGIMWEETELSGGAAAGDTFARPVVDVDGLFVFWQSAATSAAASRSRIYLVSPDTYVQPVHISAQNFIPGERTSGDRAQLSWSIPDDPSGIVGFSWVWSRDSSALPPTAGNVMVYNSGVEPELELFAEEDGEWFLAVSAQDFAGNWSAPTRASFFRDTTPPPAAVIIPPQLDARGYLLSNSFRISWNAPPASDIAGYTWDIEYLGAAGAFSGMGGEQFTAAVRQRFPQTQAPVPSVQGTATFAAYENYDDGVWRFSVRAIDEAGNVGPSSILIFRTNKYIPSTFITFVDSERDETDFYNIGILGRGFSQGGAVARVFVDRSGQPPFDREFFLSLGDFDVVSDREIRGLAVQGLEAGLYRIGVEHPTRGIYFTEPIVEIAETGTIKFGDFSASWKPLWLLRNERLFRANAVTLVLAAVLILCALGLLVSARGISGVITEGVRLRLDAAALVSGELMASEKKKRVITIQKRGISLRLKMTFFTITLVLAVVIMIASPLYVMMTETQRKTLIQGLWDRSTVLLEGVAASARTHLPLQSILELGLLPNQMQAIPEAQHITITGHNPGTTIFDDQVWATNDPNILSKINTAAFQPGVSRITDVLSPRLQTIADDLNEQARREVGDMSQTIALFTQEALALALRTDAESLRQLGDLQVQTLALQTRVSQRLSELARNIGSEPLFSVEQLIASPDHRYIFFKPIMFRQGTENMYFRGLVRMEVSVTSILDEITAGRNAIIKLIIIVALIALSAGAIGALLLSSLIIRPIRQLVKHVELIRDTENKAELAGLDINLKSKDEIAILGDTINDMTHGLVKAAAAAADLSIGKEIQKKFIPLELDRDGNKLNHGSKKTAHLNFFGYYEGAKGVSGDYFDYIDLDDRYYAIIKCDVAGKGIPAALIMIQVATMFLNYFKQWKPTEKGMQIEKLVYQINDFIETLGFKGRFAAFTLCLFDSQTGTVHFCNAGDNIVRYYDVSAGQLKTVTLPQTPATGVLPNYLVETKGGYTVQTLTLDRGDILLLYTDGIEEAKRKFRNAAFEEILCEEGAADTSHENHYSGQADEELGGERVTDIINAVMNRQVYTLHKWHDPEAQGGSLQFDFSSCEGTVEEVITAMISVEKIFRCYKSPSHTDENWVQAEKTVDDFLQRHFVQYRRYCSFTRPASDNSAYTYYTHISEDEQYDDLTILGIQRK
ncbi:MAG: SpoIIE family protein phosphatase [Treponema sp.]|nr:SpoIIE family protein phosphatase [Treponema sp.]